MTCRLKSEGIIRLHPMKRLRRVSRSEISRAMKHFERRAKAGARAAELAQLQRLEAQKEEPSWTDADSVKETLELCHAIYESGRFTWEEYFFNTTAPVESLHQHQQLNGRYDDKLKPILLRMKEIESKYGLKPDEYWRIGSEPPAYDRLDKKYCKILDIKLSSLFREFSLYTHARLLLNNKTEYNRLREAGRASFSESTDIEHATAKLIDVYVSEARKCARAKAYYAACLMLGSASEALILLKCLQKRAEVSAAMARNPKLRGLDKKEPQYWNLGQLIEVAKEAGWFANLRTQNVLVYVEQVVIHLRELRNLVHPGRHARQRPHISIGEEQYKDANSAYLALRYSLEKEIKAKLAKSG